MRPDRDVQRCPACRGQTVLPYGYGAMGVNRGSCPACDAQGFVDPTIVSPQYAANLRQAAARGIRQDRRRLTAKYGPGFVGGGDWRPRP